MSGDFTASFNSSLIDSFENSAGTAEYATWVGHDLIFGHSGLADDLEISGGILNIADKGPSIDPVNGYEDSIVLELYSVAGRIPFIKAKYKF